MTLVQMRDDAQFNATRSGFGKLIYLKHYDLFSAINNTTTLGTEYKMVR